MSNPSGEMLQYSYQRVPVNIDNFLFISVGHTQLPRPDEVQDGITSPVLPLHVTKETQETSPAQPGAETSTNLNPCNPPGSVAPVEHSEKMKRRIFAEDPDWCLDTVPCLSNICLETIVANYQEKPVYDQLMPVHKDFVHERLSTSLPLHITGQFDQRWGLLEEMLRAAVGLLRRLLLWPQLEEDVL
ncbi:hypothetical protein fugu_017547 [Takifugu bimaculatus]|uniref:Uncharacterized protein n=1 Tax=Takifugu bimaculatus TaxID=433685 RepID=A0A4Z2BSR9_9TELE|nr:hypothetical protein fugu_017547 [Takifugu bimaculatus]